MSENPGSQQMVRLNSTDRRGRAIDAETLAAAQAIADRLIRYAEKLIRCPAQATSLLEESAATVSRALRRRAELGMPPVLNLQSYLFRAFIRRVNGVQRREALLCRKLATENHHSHSGAGLFEDLELKVLVDEFVTRCDPVMRDMFYRRMRGQSWEEVGKAHGISAHAAESRFGRQLKRIRKHLGLE